MKNIFSCLGFILFLISTNANAHISINLYNNSNYDLTRTQQSNDNLDLWNFPNTILANGYEYVHFAYSGFFSWKGNGDVSYQTTCNNGQIETIHLRADLLTAEYHELYSRLAIIISGGNCVLVTPLQANFMLNSNDSTHTYGFFAVTFSNNS
jgi:hypothetical protein